MPDKVAVVRAPANRASILGHASNGLGQVEENKIVYRGNVRECPVSFTGIRTMADQNRSGVTVTSKTTLILPYICASVVSQR